LALGDYYHAESARNADQHIQDMASRAVSVMGKMAFGSVVERAIERSALLLIGALS